MERELDLQRTSTFCSFHTPNQVKTGSDQKERHKEIERRKTRTAYWFAIDEEYPPRLDTTRAPLDAALFDFLHRPHPSPMALEPSQAHRAARARARVSRRLRESRV